MATGFIYVVTSEGPIDVMNSPVPNQSLVVSDPEILSGEPVFAGTRIAIDTVLASLDAGIDMARIRLSFPIVDDEHIATARAYRTAHPRSRGLRISEMHPDLLVLRRSRVFKK
jgi:uncharacterized protein (DUF433 family)